MITARVLFSQRFLDARTRRFLAGRGIALDVLDLPAGRADADLSQDELAQRLVGVDGWIVGHVRIDRAILERIPSVRVIARRGVGHEKVDLAAAAELGKVVTIARGGNEETVADHTIGLMLSVGRRISESQTVMRKGHWSILPGTDLYRKTVGLIGLGPIARAVVARLKGFQVEILVATPRPDPSLAGVEFVDLEALLKRSDYVSLHAPQSAATQSMIGGAALALMKPSSILINTARASLVDEAALLDALSTGRLRGAALDVLGAEATPSQRPLAEALLALPNVVVTPHAAASTDEALARTNMIAAQSIVAVLEGGSPPPTCIVADGRVGKKMHS